MNRKLELSGYMKLGTSMKIAESNTMNVYLNIIIEKMYNITALNEGEEYILFTHIVIQKKKKKKKTTSGTSAMSSLFIQMLQ